MSGLRTLIESRMLAYERGLAGLPTRHGPLDADADRRARDRAADLHAQLTAAADAAEARAAERVAAWERPDPDRPGRIRSTAELRARMETRALELGHDPDTALELAGYTKQNEGWVAGDPDLAMYATAGAAALARLDPDTSRPATGERVRAVALRLLELPVALDGTVWLPVEPGSGDAAQVAYLHAVGAVEWHKERGTRRRAGHRVTLRLDHPWWQRIR